MNRFLNWSQSLMSRLRAASTRAVQEAQMDRSELQRDWLYNNSLTAFVGALLMLLARNIHLSNEGVTSRLLKNYWGRSTSSWGQRQA